MKVLYKSHLAINCMSDTGDTGLDKLITCWHPKSEVITSVLLILDILLNKTSLKLILKQTSVFVPGNHAFDSVKHIFENDHIMENTPSLCYLYFHKVRQTNHFIAFKTVDHCTDFQGKPQCTQQATLKLLN